jgi:predicted amidohydrolase
VRGEDPERQELGEADWERSEDVVLAMVDLPAFLWRRRAERVMS